MVIIMIKIKTTVVIMTITIIIIVIIIRRRRRIKIANRNIKTLKWKKKCSSKSNSCLLNRRNHSESHVLLELKSHKT